MEIIENRLSVADQIHSPNFDIRPDANDISLLVIHCISLPPGEFGSNHIDDLFTNQLDRHQHPYFEEIYQLNVSAHLLVKRDGSIVQYVPFNLRAWHAGVSHYQGRDKCNDFSIGIELEGTEFLPYTDAQYQQLSNVVRVLVGHYPQLSKTTIVGHSDIAPGRKTDPGDSFDWQRLFALIA